MGLFSNKKSDVITRRLDESIVPYEITELQNRMSAKVAGQDRAVEQFVRVQETILSDLSAPDKPLGVFLFVGPTGSGKTHVAETFADIQDATLIKIDCAEFQHSHEVSKLIGAPPGYLGHRDSKPRINKEAIEAKWEKSKNKFSIVLFDEIEKGNQSVHQILLGIMDRGVMTLGDNTQVDLKNCIIVMTSNLGSGEVKKLLQTAGGYGFGVRDTETTNGESALDDEIYQASKAAVKKFFSPEFFNRIDRMVVFRSLDEDTLRKILNIELDRVQDRVMKANKFVCVEVSDRGKDFLIEEGTSKELGARELRRTIERLLVTKLTRAFATKQAVSGDMIVADKEPETKNLTLDIAKGVMEVPPPAPVPGELVVHKPKPTFVTPENPTAREGGPGKLDAGYCARCGFRWYAAHICFDLLDGPLDTYRRDQNKKRKS